MYKSVMEKKLTNTCFRNILYMQGGKKHFEAAEAWSNKIMTNRSPSSNAHKS